jgi:hypothetical protein
MFPFLILKCINPVIGIFKMPKKKKKLVGLEKGISCLGFSVQNGFVAAFPKKRC